MKKLKLSSPGKINLRLDVFEKRWDGYHELRSIMERIDINDEIELSIIERGVEISSDDPDLPKDEQNIVYDAAKEILAYSSRGAGVKIHIKKRIPMAAGLGGGSSNAAVVIQAINVLLDLKLNKEKLMKIGAKIGADVPFFMIDGPALAKGIGDELVKIENMPKLHFVIVNPNQAVSTEWVYKNYEPRLSVTGKVVGKTKDIELSFKSKRDVISILNNDLEDVTAKKFPEVDEIKSLLNESGAMGSQMTGSGPTVFGIFADKKKQESAYQSMKEKYGDRWKIFKAENLAA